MAEGKISTITGALLIACAITAGVVIINNIRLQQIGRSENTAPNDVRVSNITDTSFNISWITNTKTTGSVGWDTNQSSFKKKEKDRIENPSYAHSIKVNNLAPSKMYYFNIISNNKIFDNNGTAWQVKTAPTKTTSSQPNTISGSVFNRFNLPVKNTLVYITVGGSSLLSTLTSENGSWVLSISDARTQDLENYIVVDEYKSLIEIFVQAGPYGKASAQIYPISAKPSPPIILGQTHNFKTINIKEEESPDAKINVPADDFKTPNFPID